MATPINPVPPAPPMQPVGNNSGMGPQSTLPPELQGLNWGAFLLSWIWGIGHSTWLALLALVPYVGWIMSIVLLIKGNEWAWQNRKWDSIEQFKTVQSIWLKWGIIVLIASFILAILWVVILVPVFMKAAQQATPPSY